uniref:ZP domain-containing protein n=1 Tax=Parascaris univalens TaxID=6257 RepID=A0A914ZZ93_PARUN
VPLEQDPLLEECLKDGLRLHFFPEAPFRGHVYVKGFFADRNCHLSYTSHPLHTPFFFHVPYHSQCNVRRERTIHPPGITYRIIVIVQHHRLFLTAADKAYSVSCFYRERLSQLSKTVQVGNLPTTEIVQGEQLPTCIYEVLNGSLSGDPVKFANIGDKLVHRWHCDSDKHGMLVHSCVICDPAGNQFELIDERGCIRDDTLMEPLKYSSDLMTASSAAFAFKFADQMIVHFSCRITLCTRAENGCEGISPPICQFFPLPWNIPYDNVASTRGAKAYFSSTTPNIPSKPLSNSERIPLPPAVSTVAAIMPVAGSLPHGATAAVPRLAKLSNPENPTVYGVPTPVNDSMDFFFDYNSGSIRAHERTRWRRSNVIANNETRDDDDITFDVSADQVIIFSRDEMAQERMIAKPLMECRRTGLPISVFLIIFCILLAVSGMALYFQKRFYERRFVDCSFTPNLEMLRIKNF